MSARHLIYFLGTAIVPSVFTSSCGFKVEQQPNTKATSGAGQYYVIGRYYCVDSKDGSDRGTCDLESRVKTGCADALTAQQQEVASRGDICQRCLANQIDNTRRYNGKHEFIQGGPCTGYGQ